jgi:hypothetical protein
MIYTYSRNFEVLSIFVINMNFLTITLKIYNNNFQSFKKIHKIFRTYIRCIPLFIKNINFYLNLWWKDVGVSMESLIPQS